jgi:predicted dehydrogenase
MIKVAVIGAGWFAAENHIPTLAARKDVILDGVCRLGAEALEHVRSAFGFAFAAEDHREMLARRPDVVIVASPHALHYRHALDALEAGAHVLCEKPMTLDPADAWALVSRARELKRHLVIANGYHWLPHLKEIGDMLKGGAVGRIEHVACTFVSATRPVFEGEVGFKRWQTSFFRPAIDTWQDPAGGGGFAYGQMSHSIALALWLTGLAPAEVAAHAFGTGAIDLADAAVVRFAGGAVGSFSGAAAMPEGQRALLRLVISGAGGVASLELDRDFAELRLVGGEVRRIPVAAGDWVYNCRGPVNAIVDLAGGVGENLAPGEIGAATVSVMEGMLRSSRNGGGVVRLDLPRRAT